MNHEAHPASEAVIDFQQCVAGQVSLQHRHSDEGSENYAAEPDYRRDEVYASDAEFYNCAHFSFQALFRVNDNLSGVTMSTARSALI